MPKLYRHFVSRFQNRLFFVYTLLVLVLTQLILNVFYYVTAGTFKRESSQLLTQTGEKILYTTDFIVENMNATALQVISDSALQSIMLRSNQYTGPYNYFDFYDRDVIYDLLFTINTPLLNYARISVFDAKRNYVTAGYLSTKDAAFQANFENDFEPFFDSDPDGTVALLIPPRQDTWSNNPDNLLVTYMRALPNFTNARQILGAVTVSLPYSTFEDACETATDPTLSIIVLDANDQIIYPYSQLSRSQVSQVSSLTEGSFGPVELDGFSDSQYYCLQSSTVSGLRIYVLQNAEDYLFPVTTLRHTLFWFELVFYLFTLLTLFFITWRVTRPITRLRKMVESLTPENLSLDTSENFNNNEITLLSEAFNRTIQKLNRTTEENLIAERNQAEAHVLAMQSQMNPHFLYNTLMAISGIAEESDNLMIVSICNKLSSMLHYISSFKETIVPLSDELIYTRDYLELMKIRYENFLEYVIESDEAALRCRTPKLILQPLVENCFSHGFKNRTPPYRVHISITIRHNRLYISIYDNGEGFSEEALKHFEEKVKEYSADFDAQKILKESSIGGLGLNSIYLRLLLQSHHHLEMQIKNDETCGSWVLINLPTNPA